MRTKLVCFDLDDTLIRGIHSVMLPCILNGKEKEHAVIQEKENSGALDYRVADYLRAELLLGLDESKISRYFLDIVKPLENIFEVVKLLHEHNIKCIIITVGPKQVAKAFCNLWGFDGFYGSNYEVVDGKFTGKILEYIKSENKVDCLKDFCLKNDIKAEECIAIGDGSTDIPVFEHCKASIAINSSEKVKKKATYAIDTDDLLNVINLIA